MRATWAASPSRTPGSAGVLAYGQVSAMAERPRSMAGRSTWLALFGGGSVLARYVAD